jgi:hypothetical protein
VVLFLSGWEDPQFLGLSLFLDDVTSGFWRILPGTLSFSGPEAWKQLMGEAVCSSPTSLAVTVNIGPQETGRQ